MTLACNTHTNKEWPLTKIFLYFHNRKWIKSKDEEIINGKNGERIFISSDLIILRESKVRRFWLQLIWVLQT